MAIFYRESGLSWGQYIQQQAFVSDLTQEMNSSAMQAVDRTLVGLRSLVTEQQSVREEYLRRTLSPFQVVDERLAQLGREMWRVNSSIELLNANFNWAMGAVIDELQYANSQHAWANALLEGILEEVGKADVDKEIRWLTQRALLNYSARPALIQDALTLFHQAEARYAGHCDQPALLHRLGMIYMYEPRYVDTARALDYLQRAWPYYRRDGKMQLAAECLFHASVLHYSAGRVQEALGAVQQGLALYGDFSEAKYAAAKYSVRANPGAAMAWLRQAIAADRDYALKVLNDPDFNPVSQAVSGLLQKLAEEARTEFHSLQSQEEVAFPPEPLRELVGHTYQELESLRASARSRGGARSLYGWLDGVLAWQALQKARLTWEGRNKWLLQRHVEFSTVQSENVQLASVILRDFDVRLERVRAFLLEVVAYQVPLIRCDADLNNALAFVKGWQAELRRLFKCGEWNGRERAPLICEVNPELAKYVSDLITPCGELLGLKNGSQGKEIRGEQWPWPEAWRGQSALHPDGEMLVASHQGVLRGVSLVREVVVWERQSRVREAVLICPDGSCGVTQEWGHGEWEIVFFDVRSGQVLRRVKASPVSTTLRFSLNGQYLGWDEGNPGGTHRVVRVCDGQEVTPVQAIPGTLISTRRTMITPEFLDGSALVAYPRGGGFLLTWKGVIGRYARDLEHTRQNQMQIYERVHRVNEDRRRTEEQQKAVANAAAARARREDDERRAHERERERQGRCVRCGKVLLWAWSSRDGRHCKACKP